MRPRLPALLAAGLVLAAPAFAAHLELEAHDLRKCLQWSITRADQPVRTAAYRAAKARARAGYEVFAAKADLPEGGQLHQYGACAYRRSGGKARLACMPVLDFPLAGASFVPADQQRFKSATALRCASGCDQKIPDLVYELHVHAVKNLADQDKEERARGTLLRRACSGLR